MFFNKRGVEKQKRKNKKYCINVRPQSEKYHTKPRVSAMEKRHRYIFCSHCKLFLFYTSGRWVLNITWAGLFTHISSTTKNTMLPQSRNCNGGRKSTLLKLSKLWLAAGNPRVSAVDCNRMPSAGYSLTWQRGVRMMRRSNHLSLTAHRPVCEFLSLILNIII